MLIKALRKKPFGQWELIKVENTAEAIQKQIGGLTETHLASGGLNLVSLQHRGLMDSHGKYNFTRFGGYAFFGTVLLFGSDKEKPEEFGDVPAEVVQELEGTTKAI